MVTTFTRLDKLQLLINIEKSKYKNAITSNQRYEIIKRIHQTLLTLEAEVLLLMKSLNERYLKNL